MAYTRWEVNMAESLYDYDPAAALNSEEAIAIFMADAFETGDAAYIAKALGLDLTAVPAYSGQLFYITFHASHFQ